MLILKNWVSAVRYAVNLYEEHEVPLNDAYSSAVAQFRSLRSEHDIASTVALLEAESLGIEFGATAVEKNFKKEEIALDTWKDRPELDASERAARKRWQTITDRETGEWTRGQTYTRLWQEGVRPTYMSVLEEPTVPVDPLPSSAPADGAGQQKRNTLDFMGLENRT